MPNPFGYADMHEIIVVFFGFVKMLFVSIDNIDLQLRTAAIVHCYNSQRLSH